MVLTAQIIFWLLALDCICYNALVYIGPRWYIHHFRHISRLVPAAKGWAAYYIVLVLWIGLLTFHIV
jgi:hypothetical protein